MYKLILVCFTYFGNLKKLFWSQEWSMVYKIILENSFSQGLDSVFSNSGIFLIKNSSIGKRESKLKWNNVRRLKFSLLHKEKRLGKLKLQIK